VENGHRAVTDDVAAAYDRVLATSGQFASALARAGAAGTPLPWDQSGTVVVLAGLTSGGGVDRRMFIAASGAATAVTATRWRSALASSGRLLPGTGSRQVGQELVSGEQSAYLHHVNDAYDALAAADPFLHVVDVTGLAEDQAHEAALAVLAAAGYLFPSRCTRRSPSRGTGQ
jgi:hypothetical protein